MSRRFLLVLELVLVGVPWASVGCSRSEVQSSARPERPATVSETEEQVSKPATDTIVLEGTVIRKSWTKSGESWNAGGSRYYVLDVGVAVISHRSAREGVILRQSDSVPFDVFERFKGHRVAVEGRFVEGKPWMPRGEGVEQHPVTSELIPLIRGSGFEVFEITRLDEEAP